jgi:hypothetical protein
MGSFEHSGFVFGAWTTLKRTIAVIMPSMGRPHMHSQLSLHCQSCPAMSQKCLCIATQHFSGSISVVPDRSASVVTQTLVPLLRVYEAANGNDGGRTHCPSVLVAQVTPITTGTPPRKSRILERSTGRGDDLTELTWVPNFPHCIHCFWNAHVFG